MIRIAIVEDEKDQYEYVASLMEKWGVTRSVKLSISYVASAEEFLFKYEKQTPFDILFLDVCMKQMNGMELARAIRKYDRIVQIVFLTGISDYVFEGYEIGAVRYLIKPIDEAKLTEVMDICRSKLTKGPEDYFSFKYVGEVMRILKDDIIYLQVDGHYVKMITCNDTYEWKDSLKEISQRLEAERFVPVNRSSIVNMDYVCRITRENCILEGGEEIPVSRGAYARLNEAFMRYYF